MCAHYLILYRSCGYLVYTPHAQQISVNLKDVSTRYNQINCLVSKRLVSSVFGEQKTRLLAIVSRSGQWERLALTQRRLGRVSEINQCPGSLPTRKILNTVFVRLRALGASTSHKFLKVSEDELQSMRSRSDRTSDEVSWHNQPGKNKGLLESLAKCKKRNLAVYPVILTSRLVSNAYLKGIMMTIKVVVTP